jgi:hypothetical protein
MTLCGRHARVKPENLVLWSTVHQPKTASVIKIQSVVRGWLLRQRLKMSGPGVLNRKAVSNTEDLETFDDVNRVNPFDYFGFEENGKLWWFRFHTLWKWSVRSVAPTNPYTKVPLSSETRKRLRALWAYNHRHRIETPDETVGVEDRIIQRWNVICQLFHDNGFGEFQPRMFMRMSKSDYVLFFRMIHDDLAIAFPEKSRVRHICSRYCLQIMSSSHSVSSMLYLLRATWILHLLTTIPKDPYILCFTMMSALYRL